MLNHIPHGDYIERTRIKVRLLQGSIEHEKPELLTRVSRSYGTGLNPINPPTVLTHCLQEIPSRASNVQNMPTGRMMLAHCPAKLTQAIESVPSPKKGFVLPHGADVLIILSWVVNIEQLFESWPRILIDQGAIAALDYGKHIP